MLLVGLGRRVRAGVVSERFARLVPTAASASTLGPQLPLLRTRALSNGASTDGRGPRGADSADTAGTAAKGGQEQGQGVVTSQLKGVRREDMRSFVVLAHVDHGKSSLSDRLLELAGNVKLEAGGERQVLDDLKVERERGITVKARTASMLWQHAGRAHLLNLVDTPGHVDFAYEILRSLRACQGALVLVDATQGLQAQTLANYGLAKEAGLQVLPVLTKMDLPHSDPAMALEQMERVLGIPEEDVIWTSAKTGEGCEEIMEAIVERLPAPPDASQSLPAGAAFRGVIVDSWHDTFRGVVCLVYVEAGELGVGTKFFSESALLQAKAAKPFEAKELGVLIPQPSPQETLRAGQVGYLIGGIKDLGLARNGDAISDSAEDVAAAGERAAAAEGGTRGSAEEQAAERERIMAPKVYASIYPVDSGDFEELRKSLDRLLLNDASVQVKAEASGALGSGFRCGFLGKLHMEVFFQRLEEEYDQEVIATAPATPYVAVMRDGSRVVAETPAQLPDNQKKTVAYYLEPMADVVVMMPTHCMGEVTKALKERRAVQQSVEHIDDSRMLLRYRMPWQEVIVDLHDVLKSLSSGFASLEYAEAESERSDIVKVEMRINGKPLDALTFVAHRSVADRRGREVAKKLKKAIKRQQFEVIIQAAINSKVLAKERIPPYKKDVLMKSGKLVGGGDTTRKQKLLSRQKEGKKKMKTVGNIELPQSAFFAILGN